ncbi:MAG: hypothetical protein IJA19_01945 [Clostridia bacterium]|nr:hypothetical protein [Clostridia bacterium]
MLNKKCVLYEEKICDNCGECDICDLDPEKICDNCGKCIDYSPECKFAEINIEKIITE